MEYKEFKKLRLSCNVSQVKAAEIAGVTQAQISQIESGRRKLTEEIKTRLVKYYQYVLDRTYRNDVLDAKFDWVRIRFRTNDWELIAREYLCIHPDMFIYKHTGKFGYVACYDFGKIQVLESKKGDNRGVLIELTGQGCRNYEAILEERGETWKDFFYRCKAFGDMSYRRVDYALDDKIGIVSIPELIKKVEKGHFKTKFRSTRSISEQQLKESTDSGATLYLGSRQGTIHFAFYEKDYEQAKKLKEPIETMEIKNRYEVRLMNERANKFIDEYLTRSDCSLVIRSLFDQYVTFYDYDKNSKELVESKAWRKLLQDTVEIDFRMEPEPYSFQKSMRWMKYQGSKTLKKLREYGKYMEHDFIEEMIEEADLTDDEAMEVVQAVTELDEMVVKKQI